MVTPRPLKLRAQIGQSSPSAVATHLPIAKVLVDTGVYHLDDTYDYEIPEHLSHLDLIGCRVQVEFGHGQTEGIICDRVAESSSTARLKQIIKLISPHPVTNIQSLALIRATARRWGSNPYDVIRSAIPPRVAAVDKEDFVTLPFHYQKSTHQSVPEAFKKEQVKSYWMLPPSLDASLLLAKLAVERVKYGQVLVIVPDERMLIRVLDQLGKVFGENVGRLDGHNVRSNRYRDYLRMTRGITRIGVGLRGAVFTPMESGSTAIIYEDSSEQYYEPRVPGWNVRDVALLRTQVEGTNIIYAGYAPSLELARLIESGWLGVSNSQQSMKVVAVDSKLGELLPSKIFGVVRKALKTGPVLFLVPRKGYGNAVLCRKCRNISICECGGRLSKASKIAPPQCVICFKKYEDWHCTWCQSDEVFVAARGIDRFAEEVGRAFPNYPVVNSSGDHIIETVVHAPSLVLATSGAQPGVEGGYAAVILLEGLRFFAHTHLRTQESARETFLATASLVTEGCEIGIVIDPVHPIVGALTRWNCAPMIRKELQERQELQLPPSYRYIVIECATKEAFSLKNGLEKAIAEGRIPKSTRMIGPHAGSGDISRLSLAVAVNEADLLVDFLHELQKRRNISRKDLLDMRVDPYSLS